MTDYPSDRKSCGYSIRFIKAIFESDAIREHGPEAILLAVFIASREDRLHYAKPPSFWRAELMDRFGNGSPKGFLRIRNAAIEAGLLYHFEATRSKPGLYWTLVPEWLKPRFEAFRKRNGSKAKRSENGTESGTESGTANGSLSIPITHIPMTEKRPRFIAPTLEDIKAYCNERRNAVDPEQFSNHYTANGWVQGKGKPIRDWKAAIRTWEKNGFANTIPARRAYAGKEYERFSDRRAQA